MVWQPLWKTGEIIRHILTGKPMLVLHIYHLGPNSTATMVVDLECGVNPTPTFVLQQRDYDSWVCDRQVKPASDEGNDDFDVKYYQLPNA